MLLERSRLLVELVLQAEEALLAVDVGTSKGDAVAEG